MVGFPGSFVGDDSDATGPAATAHESPPTNAIPGVAQRSRMIPQMSTSGATASIPDGSDTRVEPASRGHQSGLHSIFGRFSRLDGRMSSIVHPFAPAHGRLCCVIVAGPQHGRTPRSGLIAALTTAVRDATACACPCRSRRTRCAVVVEEDDRRRANARRFTSRSATARSGDDLSLTERSAPCQVDVEIKGRDAASIWGKPKCLRFDVWRP